MNIICKLYLIIYFIYLFFGYDFITRMLHGDNIKNINKSIIFKRILQLSLITLGLTAYMFNDNINSTTYIIVLLSNLIVCIGYYVKFYPVKDLLTWIFHIIWALPILFVPFFCNINQPINYHVIAIFITLLIMYKFILENYVYG